MRMRAQVMSSDLTMEPEASVSTSFKSDTVLQSLVDLTSGATLLKAGRSVRKAYSQYHLLVFLALDAIWTESGHQSHR